MPYKDPEKRKEHHRKYWKGYYQKNKDKIREKSEKWRLENKEKVNARQRIWNEKNREKRREYSKRWRERHPDKSRESNKNQHIKKYALMKENVREIKGSLCCEKCGYNPDLPGKTFNVIELHHFNSSIKKFDLSRYMKWANTEKNKQLLREELSKGLLLCRNCHIEAHTFGGSFYDYF